MNMVMMVDDHNYSYSKCLSLISRCQWKRHCIKTNILSKAWKEVSSEKVTTRVVLHEGDGRGDRTLTLEKITSYRKPEEDVAATDTQRDSIRFG